MRDMQAALTETPDVTQAVLQDVTLEIGGKVLVDRLDLALAPQGMTMVLGPNGAGKSLFLKLLHGLIAPSSGRVLWGDQPLNLTIRTRQAMVFQHPVLLRRSVAANVDFVLPRRSSDKRDTLLDRVGLLPFATRPARQLSGGEQQRLALARAMATDPQVLFLDEATASLDPGSIKMIEDILCSARDAGTKIIFVSHDVGQARRLADEIVFLNGGRLAEHGPADPFFDAPKSPSAQAYLAGRLGV